MALSEALSRLSNAAKQATANVKNSVSVPTMPALSEIPSKISTGASDLAGSYIDGLLDFDGTTSPDYHRFMRVIENQDLQRTNMFLVRFGDFRTTIDKNGITNFDTSKNFDGLTDNLPGGVKYAWGRVQSVINDNMRNVVIPKITKSLGNTGYDLIKTIPGVGEVINGLTGVDYDVNRDLALMVKSVTIPGSNIEVQINKTDRLPFHEIRGRTFDNVTVQFYCSPGFDERILMLAWQNEIHNNKRATYGFYHSYAKDIDILTLDRQGVMQSLVHCEGCFPVRVGPVQMDYENNSQLAYIEVEFAVAHASHNKAQGKKNPVDSVKDLIAKGKDLKGLAKKLF